MTENAQHGDEYASGPTAPRPLAHMPRRAHISTLPASGALRPGANTGPRRILPVNPGRPFALEGGGRLDAVDVAYETAGTLAPDGSNAVLVCHALTGDSHVTRASDRAASTPGWWDSVVRAGGGIDTDRWFVVCVNVLGGCQGSTGPSSAHPDDGRPYGSRFPVVSVRDMVRTQASVADHLGIERWHAVIGGSMGGMQALEWAVMFPERVSAIAVVASCAAASAQQIAWWSTGRRIIRMDPAWNDGDYYDAGDGQGPHEGLAVARMVSQITFRSDEVFTDRFGRELVEPLDQFHMWQRFQVERYLEHHGDKLVRRFDANSYLVLTKAMDLHDVGRGRGGSQAAIARIRCPILGIGVSSDILYPARHTADVVNQALLAGVPARFHLLDSPQGHDAFLIEADAVNGQLGPFLDDPLGCTQGT